jgi:hypothetical protein
MAVPMTATPIPTKMAKTTGEANMPNMFFFFAPDQKSLLIANEIATGDGEWGTDSEENKGDDRGDAESTRSHEVER